MRDPSRENACGTVEIPQGKEKRRKLHNQMEKPKKQGSLKEEKSVLSL